MEIISLTDKGVTRKDNQDNYWSAILDVNGSEAGVVCLCDGMGGLDNGELASRIVVTAVREYFLSSFDLDGIGEVLGKVNLEIKGISQSSPNKMMGTTCTMLICYKGIYKICHIGDSRAYLIRNGTASLLTYDHSAINVYNISKKENPELWEKYKSKLTKCIGVKDRIEPDYYNGSYSEGDSFFLCSDGCWHYLDDCGFPVNNIKDLSNIFKSCISYGETDNITAGVLCI